jgi:lipopolysaccharide transport system ATP-binding protein
MNETSTDALRQDITEAMQTVLACNNVGKQYLGCSGVYEALKQVSFEVKKGEVVGIVGKNGCGKSTLLKILAGVVKPTAGSVEVRGKVLAVLEVGAGFIPELSGAENVEMVCRLHGLCDEEVAIVYSEIIAFSEIEYAMNEPVKNYSQGMYLRLAAAVVFALRADIYLFDEVLAVGDEAFQKKCFRKFQDLAKNGSTLLIVSHSFTQIAAVCTRCMVLSQGAIIADGSTDEVYEIFESSLLGKSVEQKEPVLETLVEGHVKIHQFNLSKENRIKRITQESEIKFEIVWEKLLSEITVCFHINIKNEAGVLILNTANFYGSNWETIEQNNKSEVGVLKDSCEIPAYFLNKGHFFAYLKCSIFDKSQTSRLIAESEYPLSFHIQNAGEPSKLNFWTYSPAPIRTKFVWKRLEHYA